MSYVVFDKTLSNISFTANVGIGTTSAKALFHVEGIEYVAGNLGVGTTLPTLGKLHIDGMTGSTPTAIYIAPPTGVSSQRAAMQIGSWQLRQDINADGTKNFAIYKNADVGAGAANVICMDTNGNVGIGTTTPRNKLDIYGGLSLGNTGSQKTQITMTPWTDPIKNTVIENDNGFLNMYSAYGTNMNMAIPLTLRSSLYGWYIADNYAANQWPDLSGNGNNATGNGPITIASFPNSTLKYIYGGINTFINFPVGMLPTTYTLFHVAKYNGSTKGRIVTSLDGVNWLSGHYSAKSGLAYHGTTAAWITQSASTVHGDNWVISTDQNNLYRSQGVNRTVGTPTTGVNCRMGINTYAGESSDWAVAEIIVYNRTLSGTEIDQVEAYLMNKYGNATTGFATNYNFLYPLKAGVSGTELMLVNALGNVGIGTTYPLTKLHVEGVIRDLTPYIRGYFSSGATLTLTLNAVESRDIAITSSTRLYAPYNGLYYVTFNCIVTANGTTEDVARYDIYIRKNGTSFVNTLNETNTSGWHYRSASAVVYLLTTDYIDFYLNTGTMYVGTAGAFDAWRVFSMMMIG
jgi:hypothetical protein